MNKPMLLRISLSIFAIATICPFAWAEPTQPVIEQVEGVKVELQLDRTNIIVGEPVYILLKVTNENAPLKIGTFGFTPYFPEGNDIEVLVSRPGELPVRYNGTENPGVYPMQEANLDVGEKRHNEYMLLYDRTQPDGYLFGKPGEYRLDVRIHHSVLREPEKHVIAINDAVIKVSEPEGKAAEAFKLIRSPAAAKALQIMSTGDSKLLQTFRTLSTSFPDTPYASLCLYIQGVAELRKEKPDLNQAINLMRDFISRYPGHVRISSALFNIITCYHQLNQDSLGRDWFYYLMDHDPGYFLLRRENEFSYFYYFGPEMASQNRRWWLYDKQWDIEPPKKEQSGMGPGAGRML
jgi:hypothetical protein